MPKSSFQVFSDVNTKVVAGYVENKAAGSGKVVTERVDNVMGSCAGAGSGEFHMYLNSRNREKFRVESIDSQRKQEEEEKAFKDKLALNKRLDEERLQKNAKKRQRAKQRKEEFKKKTKTESKTSDDVAPGDEDASGSEPEEAQEY